MELTRAGKYLIILVLGVVVVLAMVMFSNRGDNVSAECCEKVCDMAGTGMKCQNAYRNTVMCSLDYSRYSKPGIHEVFQFIISDMSICEVTPPVETIQQNDSKTNTSNESVS